MHGPRAWGRGGGGAGGGRGGGRGAAAGAGGERGVRGGGMALAVKMASLTIKSAAKPLANVFQQWVLSRPEARRVAIAGAQRLHRWDVNITRYGLAPSS